MYREGTTIKKAWVEANEFANEFHGKETSRGNKTSFAVDKDADSARKSETFSVSSASRRYLEHYSTHSEYTKENP